MEPGRIKVTLRPSRPPASGVASGPALEADAQPRRRGPSLGVVDEADPGVPGHDEAAPTSSMWRVRWVAAFMVLLQFVVFVPPEGIDVPFPRLPVGLGFAAFIAATNLVGARLRAGAGPAVWDRIAVGEVVADSLATIGLIACFSFDPTSALWALLIVPILEGALRAQLRGALLTWAGLSVAYVVREVWAARAYEQVTLLPDSITYRLGIVLIVAVATGSLAESLRRQVVGRERAASLATILRRFGLVLGGMTDRTTIYATTLEAALLVAGTLRPPVRRAAPAPVGAVLLDGPVGDMVVVGQADVVGSDPVGTALSDGLDGVVVAAAAAHRSQLVPPAAVPGLVPLGVPATAEVVAFTPISLADSVGGGLVVWAGAVPFDELRSGLDALALTVGLTLEAAALAEELVQREGEARFRSLVQHAADVITIVDLSGTITYQSPSVERVFGYAADDLTGTEVVDLVHPDDAATMSGFVRALVGEPGSSGAIELRLRHADGTWRNVEATGVNLIEDPHVAGLLLTSRDASRRKELEAQLTHQAFHDDLTGLANRALFTDRVEHALLRRNRTAGGMAVLFCDLDDFKDVNDRLGHQAGDALLVEVARRLRDSLRPSDTVARIGGDEFAVLLEDAANVNDAVRATGRILDALAPPVSLAGQEVLVRASIGIATAAEANTVDEVLRNADVAMYMAKSRGKGRYAVFEPSMHTVAVSRHTLATDLRQAIDDGELTVAYQPVLDLTTGAIVGLEALSRWRSPVLGLVPPVEFIPVAEETGMIVALGDHVLAEVCQQVQRWQATGSQGALYASVNVSGRQFRDPSFVDQVARHLAASGLEPACLVLEVTEGVLMDGHDGATERMAAFRELGVRLAIDDFGTGYTSVSDLRRFPVDILKVDRSFVTGIDSGPGGALAASLIDLGHALGLVVVGEGVEAEAQRDRLRELGCDLAQGYLFAPPMEAGDIDALLASGAVELRWGG